MSAHSTLGPSSAHRWMNCAGSIALSAKAPRVPTSRAAAEGTVAHALAEEFVTHKIDTLGMMERVGSIVTQDGHEIEIIDEMVDGAIEYYETIRQDNLELSRANKGMALVCKAEVRVSAPSIDKRVWGTADYIQYRKGDRLIVYDYKFGKGVVVESEENEQGALYVIGAMESEAGEAFDSVEFVIVQPRAPHADGTVRRWKVDREWLKAFRVIAQKAAVETLNPGARLTAGDWCRWCPALAFCPAQHKAAAESAMVAFSDTPPVKAPDKLPDVRLMTEAQLVQAFAWEDTVNSFFEAVRAVLTERLTGGAHVAGLKLVEGRSNRQWVSEDQVVAEFGAALGDKLWEKKILSPAKLEKVVGKKHPIDHLTFKPEARKTIALDSDPRPTARSSAQEAFTALPPSAAEDVLGDLLAPTPAKMWP